MKELKFYRCMHCGNIVQMVNDSGVVPFCCGEAMNLLVANTSDGAGEKHVPAVTVEGNLVKVQVGEVIHPMLPEHHIEWIYLHTENGGQFKYLPVDGEPVAEFTLHGDQLVVAYEYCNLHGLWKYEI
jgi:desulfoferrodoxin ferrous iron-binding domain